MDRDEKEEYSELESEYADGVTIARLRAHLKAFSYMTVRWPDEPKKIGPLLVDAFTISAIIKVYDNSSLEGQQKADRMMAKDRQSFCRLAAFVIGKMK